MLTESGEFKTLVPLAAYHTGDLSIPTIGCPGINSRQQAGNLRQLALTPDEAGGQNGQVVRWLRPFVYMIDGWLGPRREVAHSLICLARCWAGLDLKLTIENRCAHMIDP
jgi:hypothetical protein